MLDSTGMPLASLKTIAAAENFPAKRRQRHPFSRFCPLGPRRAGEPGRMGTAPLGDPDPRSDMTWLVTGGAGYIGAHIVRALDGAGLRPVVIDDLSSGHAAFVPAGVPSPEFSRLCVRK